MNAIVCIGGSTGSIDVVRDILSSLPPEFEAPIAVVVHRHVDSREVLLRMMHSPGNPAILEPFDKQPLTNGGRFLAPTDYHLLVGTDRLHLSTDQADHFSRPGIGQLFFSAARSFGESAIAIVLSGADADGAAGAAFLKARGGQVIVQDPTTARAPFMPDAAIKSVPGVVIAKPDQIAGQIMSCAGQRFT